MAPARVLARVKPYLWKRALRLDIETKFPYFFFLTCLSIIRNQEARLYI